MSNNSNKQKVQTLLAGFTKHLGSQGSVKMGDATYTLADVTKVLQAYVDSLDASQAQKAKWQTARNALMDADQAARSLSKTLTGYVRGVFGNNEEVLSDFGMKPVVTKPKSPEVLVAAAAKAMATRKARNTMGKVQKAKVKGSVPSTSSSGPAQPAPR